MTYATMSRDGTLYYGVGNSSRPELYHAGMDPADRTVWKNPRLLADRKTESQFSAAWSPDGRLLAYTAVTPMDAESPGTARHRLIIRNVETGQERQFRVPGPPAVPMCWSPDGAAIYGGFIAGPVQHFGLRSISATTGEVTQVAVYPERNGLWWLSRSDDGRALLIGFKDIAAQLLVNSGTPITATALFTVPAQGGEIRRIPYPTVASVRMAAPHPDGKQVVFLATTSNSELWALEGLTTKLKTAR